MQINEAGLLPRFSLSPQKIFLTVIPSISEESQKAKQKDIRLRGYDGEKNKCSRHSRAGGNLKSEGKKELANRGNIF